MKCHVAECKNEATFGIKCDDLETDVCDACFIVHASHATTFKIIKVLVDRDWLKVDPKVTIVPKKGR